MNKIKVEESRKSFERCSWWRSDSQPHWDPAAANNRRCYGDWDGDLIAGSKGGDFLLSIYERKNRYGKLIKLENKTAELTSTANIER